MHFMPDTEDADSAAETFWPEGYKQIIREDVSPLVRKELLKEKPFASVYEQGYKAKFLDHTQFLEKIADMIAVGAENGADDVFDAIINAFLKEASLPQVGAYAHYTQMSILSEELKQKLKQNIIEEYSKDNVYVHAYKVGYTKRYPSFDEYINRIAELVITGAMNGANDILENMYHSFMKLAPIMPVRRHPRRLKMW
jgi:NADPH-dependent curcumin reductase CurA